MKWSIIISLVLHCAAAVILMFLSGSTSREKHSSNFIIQEIDLSPSFRAPVPPLVTTQPAEHDEPIHPSPNNVADTDIKSQEATEAEQQPATSEKNKIDNISSTSLGLGLSHGYFTPLADGKSLRDDVRMYYLQIVEKINREWWDKASQLKEPLHEDGVLEIAIQRDGTIEAQRFIRKTGSTEADRLIADIVKKASPLPPLPSTYEPDQFRAPLRIKAPLALFRSRE